MQAACRAAATYRDARISADACTGYNDNLASLEQRVGDFLKKLSRARFDVCSRHYCRFGEQKWYARDATFAQVLLGSPKGLAGAFTGAPSRQYKDLCIYKKRI